MMVEERIRVGTFGHQTHFHAVMVHMLQKNEESGKNCAHRLGSRFSGISTLKLAQGILSSGFASHFAMAWDIRYSVSAEKIFGYVYFTWIVSLYLFFAWKLRKVPVYRVFFILSAIGFGLLEVEVA